MLRRFIAFLFAALAFDTSVHAQTLPAFPGAAGYGGYAKGGRGGDVYHVTNLNGSGTGGTINGELDNSGTVTCGSGAPALPANFVNHGIVLDRAQVRVASAVKTGANFTVTITGYAAHTYQMQCADTLAGPCGNLGTAQSGTGPLTFTDAGGATGIARFYRIAVGP
jgi:hypothetical protein